MNDDNQFFYNCSGQLGKLPAKFKRWQTLNEYRLSWSFIVNMPISERVAESEMGFDYMMSLYIWLKPALVLKDAHKLILIQSAISIYEAVLYDYFSTYLDEDDGVLLREFSYLPASKIRQILKKKNVLSKDVEKYIKELTELRNFVHLTKSGEVSKKLIEEDMEQLFNNLKKFKAYIKAKYTEKVIYSI